MRMPSEPVMLCVGASTGNRDMQVGQALMRESARDAQAWQMSAECVSMIAREAAHSLGP